MYLDTQNGNLPAFYCSREIPISTATLHFTYLEFTMRYSFKTKSFISVLFDFWLWNKIFIKEIAQACGSKATTGEENCKGQLVQQLRHSRIELCFKIFMATADHSPVSLDKCIFFGSPHCCSGQHLPRIFYPVFSFSRKCISSATLLLTFL